MARLTTPPLSLILAISAVLFWASMDSVNVEGHSPHGDISIDDPDNGTEFEDDDTINPSGTTTFGSTDFTSKIENIHGSSTTTDTETGTSSAEQEWSHGDDITLHGSGSWEVKVWLTNDPSEFHIHSGVVNGDPI